MTVSDAELTRAIASPATAPPPATAFADWPMGWCTLGTSSELSRGPVSRERFGRRVVGYRTSGGQAVAMDARCWHMGADLGSGDVVGDCVRCPFHGWQFDATGRCARVRSGDTPPPGARQRTFATAERGGRVFVFPGDAPNHPLPFFDGVAPHELFAAPPFEFRLRCPWWLVGTNGFDVQHFLGAHDRRLVAPPAVSSPHPAARRVVATFEVVGRAWRDRLTRRVSGPFVAMDVTVWAGSLVFVQARFTRAPGGPHRTTSYGLVEIVPGTSSDDGEPTSVVRITIFVRKRPGVRGLIDPLDVRVRRQFIRAFLEPDARLLDGARYRPERLIAADRLMTDYLAWLAPVSHGNLASEEPT